MSATNIVLLVVLVLVAWVVVFLKNFVEIMCDIDGDEDTAQSPNGTKAKSIKFFSMETVRWIGETIIVLFFIVLPIILGRFWRRILKKIECAQDLEIHRTGWRKQAVYGSCSCGGIYDWGDIVVYSPRKDTPYTGFVKVCPECSSVQLEGAVSRVDVDL